MLWNKMSGSTARTKEELLQVGDELMQYMIAAGHPTSHRSQLKMMTRGAVRIAERKEKEAMERQKREEQPRQE